MSVDDKSKLTLSIQGDAAAWLRNYKYSTRKARSRPVTWTEVFETLQQEYESLRDQVDQLEAAVEV